MTVAIFAVLPAGAVLAQEQAHPASTAPSNNPLDTIAHTLKLKADPVEPADFVRDSRPSDDKLGYISTGGPRPQPQGKIMTPDQIRAREAELDSVLAKHARITGKPLPTKTYRSAAPTPQGKPAGSPAH